MTKLECPTLVGSGHEDIEGKLIEPGNEHYLSLMLAHLSDPTEFLQAEMAVLKEENAKMLEANLQYA